MAFSTPTRLAFLFLCVAGASAITCKLLRYGKLTAFYTENTVENVELPCKYVLAHFKCGDFMIKVIPRSKQDGNRFSPDNVRVVVENETSGMEWSKYTSTNRLKNYPNVSAWLEEGNADTLTVVESYNTTKKYLVVEDSAQAVFEISFSSYKDGDSKGVRVTCKSGSSKNYTNGIYPKSLCGDADGTATPATRKQALFGSNGDRDQAILYDVLDNAGGLSQQSSDCSGIASKFQACVASTTASNPNYRKENAAQVCGNMFTKRNVVSALMDSLPDGTTLPDLVDTCLKAACNLTSSG